MAVKLVKLVTGEDVIADITECDGGLTLRNMARIMIAEDSLGMMPFAPFCKTTEIFVRTEHIICQMELADEVYNAYNSRYGSGIILASQSPSFRGLE